MVFAVVLTMVLFVAEARVFHLSKDDLVVLSIQMMKTGLKKNVEMSHE